MRHAPNLSGSVPYTGGSNAKANGPPVFFYVPAISTFIREQLSFKKNRAQRSVANRSSTSVITREIQQNMSPDVALSMLVEGNKRFVERKSIRRDLMSQVVQTTDGQYPFAAILGCIDSRVPPEIVFDRGIGEIFVARVAGNVVTPDIIGSLEFATQVAGAKLIMILGHTSCGAVTGAYKQVELGHLTGLLKRIEPAVQATDEEIESPSISNFVDAVAWKNATMMTEVLIDESEVIADLVQKKQLRIVSAMYDVATGKVEVI